MASTAGKIKKVVKCPVCGTKFTKNSATHKYCSNKCARIMRPSNFIHRRKTVAQKKAISRDRFEENVKHQESTKLEQIREDRINVGPQPQTCACCPCYVQHGGSINPCSHPRLQFALIGVPARIVRLQNKCPWGLKIY